MGKIMVRFSRGDGVPAVPWGMIHLLVLAETRCIVAFFRLYVTGNFRKLRIFNPSKYETIRNFTYTVFAMNPIQMDTCFMKKIFLPLGKTWTVFLLPFLVFLIYILLVIIVKIVRFFESGA